MVGTSLALLCPPYGYILCRMTFDDVRKFALLWPEVEDGTSYGTPALKVGKKLLARVKDADTVVLMCPLDEKEMLLEAAPAIYFETDHYKGWPAILVRLSQIPPEELCHRLERTWIRQAPKKLMNAWQAAKA